MGDFAAPVFRDLLALAANGDESAIEALVRRYEPEIRRLIRMRLHHSPMRSVVDSVDITQPVLSRFFARLKDDNGDQASPEDVYRLLATMARNELIDCFRKEYRRGASDKISLEDVILANVNPGPDDVAIEQDLLHAAHNRMTQEERYILEQRRSGVGWRALGEELATSPEGLRKRMERCVARITEELELG